MVSKETISNKQGFSLNVIFLVGISVIFMPGLAAGRNIWIASIASVVSAIPVIFVFARLLYLFPGNDLFDILNTVFGRYFGKILILLYTLYVFFVCALVIRSIGDYIIEIGIFNTPLIVPASAIILLCVWAVKEGIETLSRLGQVFFNFLNPLMIITLLLLIPEMDINNIKPVLGNNSEGFLLGTFRILMFPYSEVIILTMAFSSLREKKSPYKIFFPALLTGGVLGTIYTLCVILVIGENAAMDTYYPTFIMIRRISVGTFSMRLEVVPEITYIMSGYLKAAICLLAAVKGTAKLFGYREYRCFVIPVALFILVISLVIYNNMIDVFVFFIELWPYAASIFQVVLPLFILLAAQIWINKNKKGKVQ